jgi:stearoyl-CoA desaturase (Delta-9 desaturase)
LFSALAIGYASGLGITAGAHRLWSHRSYKATWQLRVILMIFNTISYQATILNWARMHRVHHKNSDTDSDPHNITRGFFFAQFGWLLCRNDPGFSEKLAKVDASDLIADPVVMFQHKYYPILVPLLSFIMPPSIAFYCLGETLVNSFFVALIFRYVTTMQIIGLVNSAAHMFGNRPYDGFVESF